MNVALSSANFFAGAVLAASLAMVSQAFQPSPRAEPRRDIQIFIPKSDPDNSSDQDDAPHSNQDAIDPDDRRAKLIHPPNDPLPT